MNTGQYISGAGHAFVIVWAMVGGFFSSSEEVPQAVPVSLVSAEEFTAVTEAAAPREAEAPAVPEEVVEPPAQPETQPADETPTPEAPPPEPPPEPPVETPTAEPPLEDTLPEPPVPPESAPPPSPEQGSTQLDDQVQNPTVQQADRVTDVETPSTDVITESTEVSPATAPSESSELPEAVPESTSAPEETTTDIVTEADTPGAGEGGTEPPVVASLAPEHSPRPRPRRERPTPQPEPASAEPVQDEPVETPEPEQPPEEQPVELSMEEQIEIAAREAAEELAAEEARRASEQTSDTGGTGLAANGPPLSRETINGFRLAVKECWIIDPGSRAARIVVTVDFSLDQNGVLVGSPVVVSNSGGDPSAVRTAGEAAIRAIQRCNIQQRGFKLPVESYGRWRDVTMVFDAGSGSIQ